MMREAHIRKEMGMKMLVVMLLPLMLWGCGTLRYRVDKPTDGRRTGTSIQWDVVEIRFNDIWKKSLFSEYWR